MHKMRRARGTEQPPFGAQVAFKRATGGAMALGALAVGATAIGALAIRALAVKRGRIGRVEIEELEVGRLRLRVARTRHRGTTVLIEPAGLSSPMEEALSAAGAA